jgi:hypothetical protein
VEKVVFLCNPASARGTFLNTAIEFVGYKLQRLEASMLHGYPHGAVPAAEGLGRDSPIFKNYS